MDFSISAPATPIATALSSDKIIGQSNRCLVLSGYMHVDVVLRQLSFPYAAYVELERQTAWCNDRSFSRVLRHGRTMIVPPLTPFHLHLSADSSVRVLVQGEDDLTQSMLSNFEACGDRPITDACMTGHPQPTRKPLSHLLSRCVYSQPGRNWTRHEFASLLRLSTGELSRLLFSEGECMRDIVLSTRLSRF